MNFWQMANITSNYQISRSPVSAPLLRITHGGDIKGEGFY